MSKKWVTLCLAGCFGMMLGVAGVNSSSVYAAEGKKLAMEGTVFDLKASTSPTGLAVYGNVSDKARHAVSGATVTATAKPAKKGEKPTPSEAVSESDGSYSISVEDGKTYTLSASHKDLGKAKGVKLKIKEDEASNFIVNFQFKRNPPPAK